MLRIKTESVECFNEETNTFCEIESVDLTLEHSLHSISEWESKYHKSFFSSKDKTDEEIRDYIRMMILDEREDLDYDRIVDFMTDSTLSKINKYIEDSRTATKFFDLRDDSYTAPKHTYTSEEVYYQMLKLGIPFECEMWNVNRLSTLMRVCYIKETGKNNSMGRDEILRRNRELNEARKAKYNTKG